MLSVQQKDRSPLHRKVAHIGLLLARLSISSVLRAPIVQDAERILFGL